MAQVSSETPKSKTVYLHDEDGSIYPIDIPFESQPSVILYMGKPFVQKIVGTVVHADDIFTVRSFLIVEQMWSKQ